MKFFTRARVVFVFSVVVASGESVECVWATSTAVHSSAAVTAKVPCNEESDEKKASGLRYCEASTLPNGVKLAGVKKESVDLIISRAKEIVNEWYRGKDFFPRTCSLLGTTHFSGGNPEVDSNHLGQDCGPWGEITTPEVQIIRNSLGIPIGVNTGSEVNLSGYRREHAYIAGGHVQAVDCHLKRVTEQIKKSGILSVTACRAAAQGYIQQLADAEGALDSFTRNVSGVNRDVGKTREMLDKCDLKRQSGSDSQDELGVKSERLVMQACRLNAQRAGIEAIFQQIAVCEIFASAKKTFQAFENSVPERMKGHLNDWAQGCRKCGADGKCMNECYQGKVKSFLQTELAAAFGSCG